MSTDIDSGELSPATPPAVARLIRRKQDLDGFKISIDVFLWKYKLPRDHMHKRLEAIERARDKALASYNGPMFDEAMSWYENLIQLFRRDLADTIPVWRRKVLNVPIIVIVAVILVVLIMAIAIYTSTRQAKIQEVKAGMRKRPGGFIAPFAK